MDKTKHPGIYVERINLLACDIGSLAVDAKKDYNVAIISLTRKVSEDQLALSVTADFDMMHGVENPPCTLKCSFLAEYTRKATSNMTWDEFTDEYAVLHLLPFVREFVSSITLRLPFGALMLPPFNAGVLVDEYRAAQKPAIS